MSNSFASAASEPARPGGQRKQHERRQQKRGSTAFLVHWAPPLQAGQQQALPMAPSRAPGRRALGPSGETEQQVADLSSRSLCAARSTMLA